MLKSTHDGDGEKKERHNGDERQQLTATTTMMQWPGQKQDDDAMAGTENK